MVRGSPGGSSPLARSVTKGSMTTSEALLLRASTGGGAESRSHDPPWKTSEQEALGASSLCEEWRMREGRGARVIGGSSRSGDWVKG